MSKASKWVADAKVHQDAVDSFISAFPKPVAPQWENSGTIGNALVGVRVCVTTDGRAYVQTFNGCAAFLDPWNACDLARWILDTFGEDSDRR